MNPPHRHVASKFLAAVARAAAVPVALAGLLAGPVGCGQKSGVLSTTAQDEDLPFYKNFPAPVDVPIDPALTAAARQELSAQLRSDLPSDRAHAIEGLRTTLPNEAAPAVLAGLDDQNQIVRFAAAVAAGELRLAAAKPKLSAKINDPDPRVQLAARFAMHRLGDPSRTVEFERYAKDNGPRGTQVRGTAAMLLGRLGEKSAARVLYLLRVDKESTVRQQAEEALALIGDQRGLNTIFGFTVSANRYEQLFAMRTLAQLREPKYRGYADLKLRSEFPEVALAATMAMGAMDDDRGYVLAMQGLKAKESQARALAAAAFGTIGRTDAQKLLAPALKDPDSDVRAAAATALLQIAKEPKRYDRQGNRLS
jgi:HEAT repeat protein